jgi:hypothetical protein
MRNLSPSSSAMVHGEPLVYGADQSQYEYRHYSYYYGNSYNPTQQPYYVHHGPYLGGAQVAQQWSLLPTYPQYYGQWLPIQQPLPSGYQHPGGLMTPSHTPPYPIQQSLPKGSTMDELAQSRRRSAENGACSNSQTSFS